MILNLFMREVHIKPRKNHTARLCAVFGEASSEIRVFALPCFFAPPLGMLVHIDLNYVNTTFVDKKYILSIIIKYIIFLCERVLLRLYPVNVILK